MGESFIIGRGGGNSTTDVAAINVYAFSGASLTLTKGTRTKSGVGAGAGTPVTFYVDYGTWTVTSIYNGTTSTKTVKVTEAKVYECNMAGHTYGICIDCSISDPTNAVTYTDDAVGFAALSCATTGACNYGSWESIIDDIFGVKPCLYNNGARTTYLNKNNYAQDTSGSVVTITGGSGDIMVEFKKCWYKYSFSGTKLYFQVADYDRSSDGFITDAFRSEDGNDSEVDYFYYGAYEGYNESNKLRSYSGKTVTASVTFANYIDYAHATNAKYTIETLYKRMYILGLLQLVTKSRDGQATVGYGRVNSNSSGIATGTMNTKGLFYGRRDVYTEGVKVFGIENFWGNYYKFMVGILTLDTAKTLGIRRSKPSATAAQKGWFTASYFTNIGAVVPSNNYPTTCQAYGNGAVMLPTVLQSDATIGWPDYFGVSTAASQAAYVGGVWNADLGRSGPFYCNVRYASSDSNTYYTARVVAA